jgi:hypothetical protein
MQERQHEGRILGDGGVEMLDRGLELVVVGGGAVANPIHALARILASMPDADARSSCGGMRNAIRDAAATAYPRHRELRRP